MSTWMDKAPSPIYSLKLPLRGENILVIAGKAGGLLRQLRVPEERISKMYSDVTAAGSYDAALIVIGRYFEVTEPWGDLT